MKVLFVCNGNTSRSQMARALFEKYSGQKADSAGLKVRPEQEGTPIPPDAAVGFMKEEGMDISNNMRKHLTLEMLDQFDKIVVILEDKDFPEYLRNNPKVEQWNFQDTRHEGEEVYRRVIAGIKENIIKFMNENKIKMLNSTENLLPNIKLK